MIRLDHDGRLDRSAHRLHRRRRGAEASRRSSTIARSTICRPARRAPPTSAAPSSSATTTAVFMNLPRLREDIPAHLPLLAAWAKPWPGRVAVYRSPTADDFRLLTTSGRRATIGTLAEALGAGPTSRFDLGNALVVDLAGGTRRERHRPLALPRRQRLRDRDRTRRLGDRPGRRRRAASRPDATGSPGCCAASAGPNGRWRPRCRPAPASSR